MLLHVGDIFINHYTFLWVPKVMYADESFLLLSLSKVCFLSLKYKPPWVHIQCTHHTYRTITVLTVNSFELLMCTTPQEHILGSRQTWSIYFVVTALILICLPDWNIVHRITSFNVILIQISYILCADNLWLVGNAVHLVAHAEGLELLNSSAKAVYNWLRIIL